MSGPRVVYQEADPARARTHRSTAEAFRELAYTCALERPARGMRIARRIAGALPWSLSMLLVTAAITAPRWWPQ